MNEPKRATFWLVLILVIAFSAAGGILLSKWLRAEAPATVPQQKVWCA